MKKKVVLSVQNLSKVYKIYDSNLDRLKEVFGKKKYHREFVANQDISFELYEGETLGIIGTNGAGKSTLLKQIAGVTQSTGGMIYRHGRITALLELGTGFNQELSGYENIFLNGTLIGMSRKECEDRKQDIINFSELGDYIDEPIKTYSSGMKMRLAFSIALFSQPKILIVDEALSVGDAHFSAKCTQALRQRKKQKMSIIYVSHDLNSLKLLCDRLILLNKGKIVETGAPTKVLEEYNILISQLNAHNEAMRIKQDDESGIKEHGSLEASIESVVLRHRGSISDSVSAGERVEIEVSICAAEDIEGLSTGIIIKDRLGQDIYGTNAALNGRVFSMVAKESKKVRYIFDMDIKPGNYFVSAAVHRNIFTENKRLHWVDNAMEFRVVGYGQRQFAGVTDLGADMEFENSFAPLEEGCLLVTTSHSIVAIDLSTKMVRKLHCGYGLYYGAVQMGEHIFVGARRRKVSSNESMEQEKGVILEFDRKMNLICEHQPGEFALRDLHQMAARDGVLYITCTYDNMVAVFDGKEWEQWYPLEARGKDVNHINSIFIEGDDIYLLAHNFGESEIYRFDLESRKLLERISVGVQAHNIARIDGEMFVLSSHEQEIVFLSGKRIKAEGFVRGFAKIGKSYFVGSSAVATRDQRDLQDGKVLVYNERLEYEDAIVLEKEGLVLELMGIVNS